MKILLFEAAPVKQNIYVCLTLLPYFSQRGCSLMCVVSRVLGKYSKVLKNAKQRRHAKLLRKPTKKKIKPNSLVERKQ